MEVYLTVKEVAELKGCTERNVRMLISKGKIDAEAIKPDIQGPGRGGLQYRIPLASLDNKLQLKYKRLQRKKEPPAELPEPEPLNTEELTGAEREEICLWKSIVEEWRTYRNNSGLSKAEADESYIALCNIKNPMLKLTRRTLYRKDKEYKEKGEIALLDRRGKHGSHAKKLTPEVWDIFEAYYLDESRKGISLCMTLTAAELIKTGREHLLPLPSYDTFFRAVKEIPIPAIKYFRDSEKNYIGECEPFIKRRYDGLEPNDVWVADNHTFDVMVTDGEKPLRVYLTAFMDVRSRKMMGWCVTDRPCSDATIYALRKGIEKHGIPKMLHTDNGREFLFHDFGGNGFRRRKKDEEFKPPSILKELGIEFITSLPRNARAKGIERAFDTVKENFSKLFEGYTGGTILERPDKLKAVVKNPDRMKKVEEFIKYVDTYLEGIYNKQPHAGEAMYGRTPDAVFNALLTERRVATVSQLDAMFMRWSNPMKVGKNGVTLTFYGKKMQYNSQELWANYFGKQVYVRYAPDELSEVKIYDMEEKYICTAQLQEELDYIATKEDIAKLQKERRGYTKFISAYAKQKGIKVTEATELMIEEAARRLETGEELDTAVIRPIFNPEPTEYKKAAGFEGEVIEVADWTAALENLKNQKG